MPPPDDHVEPPSDEDDGLIAAGAFSPWLREVQVAIRDRGEARVPCGTCTACCTSSQFVHIGPDETATLSRIPRALRFPAPGLPRGHVLLGYDERGHCPMLVDGACSIYDHRPRTCRTYDCRVFPAAGVEVDDDAKRAIADRARRWRFEHPTARDRVEHEAVRAAARFLRDDPTLRAEGLVPRVSTQLAVLAIEVHEAFLPADADGETPGPDPDPGVVRARVRALAPPPSNG